MVSAEKWELLSLRRKETGKVLTAERLWKGAYLEEHLEPAPRISASTNEARVPGVTSQHQRFPFGKGDGAGGTPLLILLVYRTVKPVERASV